MAKKKAGRKKVTRRTSARKKAAGKKTTRKKAARRPAARKKTARKKTARKKTTRKKAARRGRPRGGGKLSAVSMEQLMAELDRRRSDLEAERDQLTARLEAIDAELGGIGGASRSGGARRSSGRSAAKSTGKRGRPRTGNSLADALQKLLKGRTMGVSEMADAVKKAGYTTRSPNFRTIVNQALISHTDRFRKVARGQYTAK